jgi:protein N-terminal methyltransferase
MSSSSPPTNTSTTSSSNPPLSGSNIDALWLNATPNGDSSTWYDKSTQYWAKIDATVGGVLGGFGHLSGVDVKESAAFVKRVMPRRLAQPFGRALDCGAGVGRTARALLAPMCRTVDLLEQDAKFLAKAQASTCRLRRRASFTVSRCRRLCPSSSIRLCGFSGSLNYLTDPDLVAFFRRLARALAPNGVIFVKENMLDSKVEGQFDFRSRRHQRHALRGRLSRRVRARRFPRIVDTELQRAFPKNLFPVRNVCTGSNHRRRRTTSQRRRGKQRKVQRRQRKYSNEPAAAAAPAPTETQ